MTLPTFLVIGAMKSGTSALWHYLREHPQVFMPTPKEVQFFSRNWDKGWPWYEQRFDAAGAALSVGEASPSYAEFAHFPEVPERIASRLPDVRLIYLVRNPVDRVASQYLHNLARGDEHRPMREAVLSHPSYLSIGSYASVVEGYLAHFPRSQLLVLESERLRDDRRDALRHVFEFLGVDPRVNHPELQREFYRADQKPRALQRSAVLSQASSRLERLTTSARARTSPGWLARRYLALGEMPDDLAAELAEIFRPEVARLRPYMDATFSGWGLA